MSISLNSNSISRYILSLKNFFLYKLSYTNFLSLIL